MTESIKVKNRILCENLGRVLRVVHYEEDIFAPGCFLVQNIREMNWTSSDRVLANCMVDSCPIDPAVDDVEFLFAQDQSCDFGKATSYYGRMRKAIAATRQHKTYQYLKGEGK